MSNDMLGLALRDVRGLLNDLMEKLCGEEGEVWLKAFKKFLRKENPWKHLGYQVTDFLNFISGGERPTIGPTNGKDMIAEASDVFTTYIDSNFKSFGIDVPSKPTKETEVQVLEMVKDGRFKQLFGSFGENLDRLCLTQSQIISFVRNHKRWLSVGGNGTFFLFKVKEEYFVADVSLESGKPRVNVCYLGGGAIWSANSGHRVVVPQP